MWLKNQKNTFLMPFSKIIKNKMLVFAKNEVRFIAT